MLYLHCRLSLQVNTSNENWLHVGRWFGFFVCFEANGIMLKLYRVKTFKSRKTVNDKSHYATLALSLLATWASSNVLQVCCEPLFQSSSKPALHLTLQNFIFRVVQSFCVLKKTQKAQSLPTKPLSCLIQLTAFKESWVLFLSSCFHST